MSAQIAALAHEAARRGHAIPDDAFAVLQDVAPLAEHCGVDMADVTEAFINLTNMGVSAENANTVLRVRLGVGCSIHGMPASQAMEALYFVAAAGLTEEEV